jgi:hypothetical protein
MSLEEIKEKAFEDKDLDKIASLLNLMHGHVTGLDGKQAFEYFKVMQWAQQSLIPKMKANIVGEIKVHEAPKKPKKSKKSD